MTWARAAVVRAIRTAAQTAVALLGAGAVDVLALDWQALASVSAGAALVSLLTSLAGLPEVDSAPGRHAQDAP